MWEQYKRTLVGMQIAILLVTTAVLFVTRQWNIGLTFFAIMQLGSVLGAVWGANLRRRILTGTSYRNPLPRG